MNDSEYEVLFVDDDPNILRALKRNLHGKYKIKTASTIDEAIQFIEEFSFQVVVSDMKMPVMNGADFLILVKEKHPESIRILLTGESGLEEAIKAINESDIYKFLTKPCPIERLTANIDSAIKLNNAHRIEELIMEKSVKGFVHIISELFDIISPEIFNRSNNVNKIVRSPRTNFPVEDKWSFEVASLLMYLGSIHFKAYKYENIYDSDLMPKILYKSASLIFEIPKFEEVHNILHDLATFYEKKVVINELDCDSKVLKLVVDYYHMTTFKGFKTQFVNLYSKDILRQIPFFLGRKVETTPKEISSMEVKPKMEVLEDIKTISGAILINKGNTLSDSDIQTIRLFAEKEILVEPFKVRAI